MFEVMAKYDGFTAMVTVEDGCYTADDIKTAFLEIAENNEYGDVEMIDNDEIEIDYSGLPNWLDESSLEEFFDNYSNSSYDDLDIWEAAQDCDVSFSNIDEAYSGQFNSDEEFARDLCEQLGEIPSNLPGYIHIDWEMTAKELMYDYSESNGHYFRMM